MSHPHSRREFCRYAALTAGAVAFSHPIWGAERSPSPAIIPEIIRLDRSRILEAARKYVGELPVTITAYSSPRSAGGKHDYFSEGDYWWPDPKNPNGPYIQRDGMSNPDNFVQHRETLIRLSVQVPALTAAWVLTRNRRYADHAADHLRAWFLNPATLMNPNLEYAQAIHGRTTGRGIGVIDTIHLVEVVRSIPFLAKPQSLSISEQQQLKKWFADYLDWMTTSKNGRDERDAKNNHGTCWVMQVAEFAQYTENQNVLDFCRARFKSVLVPNQIAQDGSFPQELRRTKRYNYCLFNLDAMATICQTLANVNDDLFTFRLADGRGFRKAVAFMFPFIANKASWPYAPDVEYFQYWPIRQPTLLFAGLALSRPDYLKVWRSLPPEPQVEEVIRNNPIRQPLLWLTKS
ncbi:MAG: alginate lyase family protein [Terriglobales bacterium]